MKINNWSHNYHPYPYLNWKQWKVNDYSNFDVVDSWGPDWWALCDVIIVMLCPAESPGQCDLTWRRNLRRVAMSLQQMALDLLSAWRGCGILLQLAHKLATRLRVPDDFTKRKAAFVTRNGCSATLSLVAWAALFQNFRTKENFLASTFPQSYNCFMAALCQQDNE